MVSSPTVPLSVLGSISVRGRLQQIGYEIKLSSVGTEETGIIEVRERH